MRWVARGWAEVRCMAASAMHAMTAYQAPPPRTTMTAACYLIAMLPTANDFLLYSKSTVKTGQHLYKSAY